MRDEFDDSRSQAAIENTPVKVTPLHSRHVDAEARMMEFGGYDMPVVYSDITTEHGLVRSKVGLFDLCHMGRIDISGPDAAVLVQKSQSNDLDRIDVGRIRYALLLTDDGGVIDDILVHRRAESIYLVVNASNRERDLARLEQLAAGLDVTIEDQSDTVGMLAVQGPGSAAVMKTLTDDIDIAGLHYYGLAEGTVLGENAMLTRTGYTGEDGFEIYAPASSMLAMWDAVLERGADHGIAPCGLGARDTLRTEAGMPLYGHEITETVNPFEAGLGFGVRLKKSEYAGRDALVRAKEAGLTRALVGLEIEGRRIPRHGYDVLAGDDKCGVVCSGTWSPTFDRAIATALCDKTALESGDVMSVDVRGRRVAARIVGLPFYKRDGSGSLQQSS